MTGEQVETVRALLASNDAALRAALINTQHAMRLLGTHERPKATREDGGGWLGDDEPEEGK